MLTEQELFEIAKIHLIRHGYRFEETAEQIRIIRPDGTIAITARKHKSKLIDPLKDVPLPLGDE